MLRGTPACRGLSLVVQNQQVPPLHQAEHADAVTRVRRHVPALRGLGVQGGKQAHARIPRDEGIRVSALQRAQHAAVPA